MRGVELALFATAVFATIGLLARALFKQMDKTDRLAERIGAVETELGVLRAFVDERTERIDERMSGFDERMAGFDERMAGFDERMARFDDRMARFEEDQRAIRGLLEQLVQRIGSLEAA